MPAISWTRMHFTMAAPANQPVQRHRTIPFDHHCSLVVCKMFGALAWVQFLANFDKFLDFIEVLLRSSFELLLCVSYGWFPVLLHLTCGLPLNSCTCFCASSCRHHFLWFCSCRVHVQILWRLVRLWVSWTDLLERFLWDWWICGKTWTVSTIGGWICLW